jgi:glycosyltransferase involved in cell wall biosynthesis
MLERAGALAGHTDHMRVIHPPGEPPPDPLPAKRAEPTVVTLGYVDPRKRHRDVLDALAGLPDVRWLVIGDGPERPSLAARADERRCTSSRAAT